MPKRVPSLTTITTDPLLAAWLSPSLSLMLSLLIGKPQMRPPILSKVSVATATVTATAAARLPTVRLVVMAVVGEGGPSRVSTCSPSSSRHFSRGTVGTGIFDNSTTRFGDGPYSCSDWNSKSSSLKSEGLEGERASQTERARHASRFPRIIPTSTSSSPHCPSPHKSESCSARNCYLGSFRGCFGIPKPT